MNSFIKYAYVVADDVPKLRDFYSQTLGMPVRFQDGSRWCQLDGGRVDLALSSAEEASPCPKGTVSVYEVIGLDEAMARATEAGGRILSRRDMGGHGGVVTCQDTEGNHFQLFAKHVRKAA